MAGASAGTDPLIARLLSVYRDKPEQIVYEGAEALMVMRRVRPGMTVFDIGANVGDYSILMSNLVGEAGRVWTIEAAGSTFRKLSERLAGHECANVRPFQRAVYSENTQIEFNEFPEEYSVWNSIGRPQMADPKDPTRQVPIERSETVEAVRLDDFCRAQGVDVIHYMKLDVEGAESEALKGARELLERRAIRFLQFEISQAMLDGMNKQAREVFDILRGHGYECHRINRDGTLGPEVEDSNAFYENYAAFPRGSVRFVTPVEKGQEHGKGLQHYSAQLAQLDFDWHWHIIGGRDAAAGVAAAHPGRVTVHPPGSTLEAPLEAVAEDCLVWRIDPVEYWTAGQLAAARALFLAHPAKTAAFYWSWFYVAPGLVTSTRHCYGNDARTQWLRTWRYRPGLRWAGEEPVLAEPLPGGQWRAVHAINPLTHAETEAAGLVMQRAAFFTEDQVRSEAGRRGLNPDEILERWRALQRVDQFPVKLRDYFPWVTDDTEVDRAEFYVANPLAANPVAADPLVTRTPTPDHPPY